HVIHSPSGYSGSGDAVGSAADAADSDSYGSVRRRFSRRDRQYNRFDTELRPQKPLRNDAL
ncbi:hypothetical protein, partial [Halorubrum lacusprofundi]|uniref:hypothetical protein n=1 Tax=Halorubrum lacusprofundi TaxID=2247 RepID=UPI001A8C9210